MILDSAKTFAAHPAMRVAEGNDWRTWTYADLGRDVTQLATALVAHGVAPGDRVALMSGNRPEWTIADFAIMCAGAIVVPIFANCSRDQAQHIVRNSQAGWVFVAGEKELDVLHPASLDGVREVWTFDAVAGHSSQQKLIDEALSEEQQAEVERRIAAAHHDDIATIIYTSGTTGDPRGAMLTHRAFTHQIDAINTLYDLGPGDQNVAFLPMAHALERIWQFHILSNGVLDTHCPNPRKIAELLPVAQPNLLISVPKLYDQVFATAQSRVASSKIKKLIFRWAVRVGGKNQRAYRKGRRPALFWSAQLLLADKLVLGSVRKALGGPKKVLISGGAPLRRQVEEFFSACGLLLGQGYGLTETGPMMTFFSPSTFKLGTVGYCIPGAEIKIGPDSEIWYRGPNVMQGYWNNPEATAAVIDADGWLHTGDIGYVDEQGYVTITDRKKDIIVTTNGKNVAPQPIEGQLLTDPLFEYAVVLGNDRPFLTLLVKPSLPHLEDLGKQMQVTWANAEELLTNNQILDEIKKRVSALTVKLPKHEQIKDVRVLPDDFTQENGLLTPTLKVKRREVERRFAAMIDDMYSRIAELRGKPRG